MTGSLRSAPLPERADAARSCAELTAARRRLLRLARSGESADVIFAALASELVDAGLERAEFFHVPSAAADGVGAGHDGVAAREAPPLAREACAAGVPVRDGDTIALPFPGGALLAARAGLDATWIEPLEEMVELLELALRVALPDGRATNLVTQEDLTEERRAALSVREQERRLSAIFESSLGAMAIARRADRALVELNDAFTATLGWSRDEAVGRTLAELGFWVDPEDEQRVAAAFDDPSPGAPLETRGRRKPGEIGVFVLSIGRLDVDGEPCAILAIQDVTAQRRADDQRREAERHLRALFDLAPIGICEVDPIAGRIVVVNEQLCRIAGESAEQLCSRSILDDLIHPDDRERVGAELASYAVGDADVLRAERRYTRPDGVPLWISLTARVLDGPAGPRVLATAHDVTDARRDTAALLTYKSAIDAAANAIVITDADGVVEVANPAFTRLTGYTQDEIVGQSIDILRSDAEPAATYQALGEAGVSGRVWRGEVVNRRKDGSLYTEDLTVTPILDEDGRPAHFVAIRQDVTERRRAQAELRHNKKRYRALVDSLEDVVFISDTEGRVSFVNRAVSMFGWTGVEVVGRDFREFVLAEDVPLATDLFAMRAHGSMKELRLVDARGKVRPVRVRLRPLAVTERDEGAIGVIVDMTASREVEEQLRASQKMEALGRLAGGVAHDFNNLLTVILASAELVASELDPRAPMRADLDRVVSAGHRAERLTRRLLAFSRRQMLVPEPTDLRELVRGMGQLLERLIGEDVDLRVEVDEDLPRVEVDRGAIEQVVMNLLVNARDAMPEGGRVTIGLRSVDVDAAHAEALGALPGAYVELEVRDTGTGMTAEVKSRIFEPFFTTKEVGKGTGLGLAMVFGIVRQSGGVVEVESELGKGAAFRVLLPRRDGAVSATPARAPGRVPRRARECVLLVEDDGALRTVVERVLRREGYEVLSSANATEAMSLAQHHGERVRLILTDVVMPLMSGPELAVHLAKHCSAARVVFMSGYTDEAIERVGAVGAEFLRKPFDVATLVARVRETIDAV